MKQFFFTLTILAFIFSGCSGIKVTADHDSNVDFTKYKTYSYLGWTEKSDVIINEFSKRRLEASFASEFNNRNMTYVLEGGDIEVSLFLVAEQKTAVSAYTDYYGGYGGYGYYGMGVGVGYGYGPSWGWGAGYSSTSYHEYDYTDGTLVCDVFDGAEKKLIWQSVASGTLGDSPSNKKIIQTVQKIMSLYPVPVNKEK